MIRKPSSTTAQYEPNPALDADDDDLPDFTLTWNGFEEALRATFGEPHPIASQSPSPGPFAALHATAAKISISRMPWVCLVVYCVVTPALSTVRKAPAHCQRQAQIVNRMEWARVMKHGTHRVGEYSDGTSSECMRHGGTAQSR